MFSSKALSGLLVLKHDLFATIIACCLVTFNVRFTPVSHKQLVNYHVCLAMSQA